MTVTQSACQSGKWSAYTKCGILLKIFSIYLSLRVTKSTEIASQIPLLMCIQMYLWIPSVAYPLPLCQKEKGARKRSHSSSTVYVCSLFSFLKILASPFHCIRSLRHLIQYYSGSPEFQTRVFCYFHWGCQGLNLAFSLSVTQWLGWMVRIQDTFAYKFRLISSLLPLTFHQIQGLYGAHQTSHFQPFLATVMNTM